MALRNRKHEVADKLRGVDLVSDEGDVNLGNFISLQNWIPADVYAIKKKRGVNPLDPNALNNIITEDGLFNLATEDGDSLITEF